ncbi:unnamed protein product [Polarella glacialis]|uniref:Uncharacterized protein n=1 Tax=Polarella glacialis TaxID=89957 RepID=A0A813IJ41_POLGL|nr:unnamed protein product [Polarella glacialis]CAE8651162.1 unnamed protein product [Polarella glacialis]
MADAASGSENINWPAITRHNQSPSFVMPSLHSGIRAGLTASCMEQVCNRLDRREFADRCYRESLVVPIFTNKATKTTVDAERIRAHISHSRQDLRPEASLADIIQQTRRGNDLMPKLERLEVTAKVGSMSTYNDGISFRARQHLELRELLRPQGAAPAPNDSQGPVTARQNREKLPLAKPGSSSARDYTSGARGFIPDKMQKKPPVVLPAVLEGADLLEAAVLRAMARPPEIRRPDTGQSWASTPIPQPYAAHAVLVRRPDHEAPTPGVTPFLHQALELGTDCAKHELGRLVFAGKKGEQQ